MNDPVLSLLGMARRAGRVVLGANLAEQTLKRGKGYLVCASSALSERTRRELARICEKGKVPLRILPYTIEELSVAIGARAGTVTITDENFAAGIDRKCDEKSDRIPDRITLDKGGN